MNLGKVVYDIGKILPYNMFPREIVFKNIFFVDEIGESIEAFFGRSLNSCLNHVPKITFRYRAFFHLVGVRYILKHYLRDYPVHLVVDEVHGDIPFMPEFLETIKKVSLKTIKLPIEYIALILNDFDSFVESCSKAKCLVTFLQPTF